MCVYVCMYVCMYIPFGWLLIFTMNCYDILCVSILPYERHVCQAELNPGEVTCTDRCVLKYLKAHLKVGEKLQNLQS